MTEGRRIFALWAVLSCASLAWADPVSSGASGQAPGAEAATLPEEVVIKGEDIGPKVGARKPPLNIVSDPFETIRPSLEPDPALLLAQSPLTAGWRHTHPDILFNQRVIEPWRGVFSERSGIVFEPLRQLQEVLQRPMSPREAKRCQWSLTIADEAGRVFQQYEGASKPPQELFWDGQNGRGQWVQPGRSYSPVFKFVDPVGAPYTRVGKPILFSGIAHQAPNGLVIALDSGVLFGPDKAASALEKPGESLLRDAADFVKRRYDGVSILVRVLAGSKELAEAQGGAVQAGLARELMLPPQSLTLQAEPAPFPEQRAEIVLLNR